MDSTSKSIIKDDDSFDDDDTLQFYNEIDVSNIIKI